MVAEEVADCVVVGVSPTDAKRVPCGVCIDAVAFACGRVAVFEQSCAESDGSSVSGGGIGHVKVEMHLLRKTIGPVRWLVVGCELHSDTPVAGSVEHRVEAVVGEHAAAKHRGPEGAFGRKIGCVEHDNVADDLHHPILPELCLQGRML